MDFWIPLSVKRFATVQVLRTVRRTLSTRQTLGKLQSSGKTGRHETKQSTNVHLTLRCGAVHSQIWQTFSQNAAHLTAEISHQSCKSAARLGRSPFEEGQDSCMRHQRSQTHKISSFTSSPPAFPGGSPPKRCARTGDRDTAGTAAGADPNLPQPRAVFQPQCHPGLCSQLWQWCLLPSPPARAASPRCKFTATPADEARRARKYLLGDCVMGLVLQLLMAKSASSLPA